MKNIIASIVYSHLWIAACAAAMVIQTTYILDGSWHFGPLVYLVFGATLFIYSAHRLVGLQKLIKIKADLNPRYIIINRDQRLVLILGLIGAIMATFFYFQLSWSTQLALIIPGLVSLAYVIPFLSGRKRLRDIGLIKIFLIAISYGIIAVALVCFELNKAFDNNVLLLFLEKTIFILAITIPFDMRDLEIDQISKVRTLPMILGWKKSKLASQALLLLCIILVGFNTMYPNHGLIAMIIAYALNAGYIAMISEKRNDLYYSFGMDGMMVAQTIVLFAVTSLKHFM